MKCKYIIHSDDFQAKEFRFFEGSDQDSMVRMRVARYHKQLQLIFQSLYFL